MNHWQKTGNEIGSNDDYAVRVRCGNCLNEGMAFLKKGIRIDESACPTCGCSELIRK